MNQRKVLIYGAGVIGCYLAHILIKEGQDVSLQMERKFRNKWYDHSSCTSTFENDKSNYYQ